MVKTEKGLPETNTAEEAGSSRIWTKTNTSAVLTHAEYDRGDWKRRK